MIETKIFEVRDRGTMMPVIATKLVSTDKLPGEIYLLERGGYSAQCPQVVVHFLEPDEGSGDPDKWTTRTRAIAHQYILKHWDKIRTCDVIDVEFVLGESKTCKVSEYYNQARCDT